MKFAAIGIVVADMDAALAFYRLLGLEVTMEPEKYDGAHAELALPGGLELMLDTADSIAAFEPGFTPRDPDAPRQVALAFACESPAAVDAAYAGIVAAGYRGHTEPWDAYWGHRYATVRDPDGTLVDLFAPLGE